MQSTHSPFTHCPMSIYLTLRAYCPFSGLRRTTKLPSGKYSSLWCASSRRIESQNLSKITTTCITTSLTNHPMKRLWVWDAWQILMLKCMSCHTPHSCGLFTQPPMRRMRICFTGVFSVFFCFFHPSQKTRQPFLGTAERIFMKLSPNDTGENGVSNVMPPPGEWLRISLCCFMLVRYCMAVALKRHEGVNAFNLV